MIGLFAFDGPLYKDKNGVYCNTTITNEMLERYFCVVDKLYLLIRTFTINQSHDEVHLTKLEMGDRIKVIEVPNLNSPIQYITKHREKVKFREIISKCDLIFLRIPSVISDMVAEICQQTGKPYLVEVGGCSWDAYFNHGLLGKVVAPIMYFNQKRTVNNAQFASYVTEKWLQNRYPAQCPQIAASNVYLRDFDEEIIKTRILRCDRSSYAPKKIGTIASIDVRYKGQEYVIRALHKLKLLGYRLDYELVGAGVGNYLKDLAKKLGIEDQIHFLGLKKHSDIWEWLDQIDIYAQPSKQEGLPRAVIEAMSRGCVCIGSTTAGIPELLDSKYVFQNGDVNQICNIIQGIYRDKDIKQNIIRNFEKSKEFDIDLLNQRRADLFSKYQTHIINMNNNE